MNSRPALHIEAARLCGRALLDLGQTASDVGGLPQTNNDAAGGFTKGGHAHGKGVYPMATRLAVVNEALVPHDRIKQWVFNAIRTAIYVDAITTPEKLADDSGVPLSCIRNYMVGTIEERRQPSASYALSIAAAIGPRAVQSFMAIIGYLVQPIEDPDEPQPAEIVAEGLQHFAVIADAARDNVFKRHERQRVTRAADEIIATLLPISSQADAA